jgi:hypothetical protein
MKGVACETLSVCAEVSRIGQCLPTVRAAVGARHRLASGHLFMDGGGRRH